MCSAEISVATVFYNHSEDEIASVVEQAKKIAHFYDVTLYLIDNYSESIETQQAVKKFAQNESGFLVISVCLEKNEGFAIGNNSILNQLNSDYHVIMNPDVVIPDPNGFKSAIEYMDANPEVGMLMPLIKGEDGKIQYLNRREPTIFDLGIRFLGPNFFKKRQEAFVKKNDGYRTIQPVENASGCFMIIRTSLFKELGGFDTRYFMYMEDTDLTKAVNQNSETRLFPELEVIHGWSRANHSFKGMKMMLKSMVQYFNKWGWQFF